QRPLLLPGNAVAVRGSGAERPVRSLRSPGRERGRLVLRDLGDDAERLGEGIDLLTAAVAGEEVGLKRLRGSRPHLLEDERDDVVPAVGAVVASGMIEVQDVVHAPLMSGAVINAFLSVTTALWRNDLTVPSLMCIASLISLIFMSL